MSNCVVGQEGSLFHEAQISTIQSYLTRLLAEGRHDDLRGIYTRFLRSPDLSRAGVLIGCYRAFNLFALELYGSFDRGIAIQLVQLAQALYAPQILDIEEQREILTMDLEEHFEWLCVLENAELFPNSFQVLLDELCPGLFEQMARLTSVSTTTLTSASSPLRMMLGLRLAGSDEKIRVLSNIDDQQMAYCMVRVGMVDAQSLGLLSNPLINEAYLAGCLL